MPFGTVAAHDVISFLDSTPYLQHFALKEREGYSYNIVSELDYPHIVSLLFTVDVTALEAGANLLHAINAPTLTDVRQAR